MKIACLLGVSKYSNCEDLLACANDVQLMRTLLDATGEYEHVLQIDGTQSSSKIKQQLVGFLTEYKGKDIDQVLFYYSGHGNFDGEEFSYLLGDYDDNRKRQTVIENSELDGWLRLLNPALAVKIVDACHAGVQYIKDPTAFKTFLNSTPASFKSCYFLFSSLKEQCSYQDASLSAFTQSLATAVKVFQGTEIRFKDMIDFVSDDFSSNSRQTPFFIIQAENTEVFSPVDAKVRAGLEAALRKYEPTASGSTGVSPPSSPPPASLLDRVTADALAYCSKDEMLKAICNVHAYWQACEYASEVSELCTFDCLLLPSLESEVPALANIGKWLSENDNAYFAVPTHREQQYEEEVEVPVKRRGIAAFALTNFYGDDYRTKKVTRTRKIVTGYRLTQEIDFPAVRITASPRFPNLSWHDFHLTYVFSKTEIRFFYLFSEFRESNWQERTRQSGDSWGMLTAPSRSDSEITAALDKVRDAFIAHIMAPVQARFGSKGSPREEGRQGN